jgi:hypothetical protein
MESRSSVHADGELKSTLPAIKSRSKPRSRGWLALGRQIIVSMVSLWRPCVTNVTPNTYANDLTRYVGYDTLVNMSYDAITYTAHEAIEIRMEDGMGNLKRLTASVTDHGTLFINMSGPSGGTSYSLANMQSPLYFPAKVVPGWQFEVIEACTAGLYTITEIR